MAQPKLISINYSTTKVSRPSSERVANDNLCFSVSITDASGFEHVLWDGHDHAQAVVKAEHSRSVLHVAEPVKDNTGITAAADWLSENWASAVNGKPLTVTLRERYDMTFQQAIAVLAEVRRRRAC